MVYKKLGITGNKPHKLPQAMIPTVKERLSEAIKNFSQKGGTDLYQGGSLGVDTWAAHYGFTHYLNVHTIAPFKRQGESWRIDDQVKYSELLYMSETVKYCSKEKTTKAYLLRNALIVKECDILLSVHSANETKGGPLWTTHYAFKQNKPVLEILVHSNRLEQVFHK